MRVILSVFLILTFFSCNPPTESVQEIILNNPANENSNVKEEPTDILQDVNVIGLNFQLPQEWMQVGDVTQAQNLKGEVITLMASFINEQNKSTLDVQFYKNPNGSLLYQAKEDDYNKKNGLYALHKETIEVNGIKAIVGKQDVSTNGKGQEMDAPQEVYVVDFMKPDGSGLYELQYKFTLAEENTGAEDVLNIILHSLKTANQQD